MNITEYLNSLNIVEDKIIKYEETNGDLNALSDAGLRTVYKEVILKYVMKVRQTNFLIDLPNPVNLAKRDSVWYQYKDDQKRTFQKRYFDYIRDISGIKIPASLIADIGETANRMRGKITEPVNIDFHFAVDWTPGEYKEKTYSCLWTDYNPGRLYLNDTGQLAAVRFYDDAGHPTGRALMVYYADALRIFNLYTINSNWTIADAALIVKSYIESIKPESPLMMDTANLYIDYLYINGNKSIMVYDKEKSPPDSVHIDDMTTCYQCGNLTADYESDRNDHCICLDCLSRYYSYCDECGEYTYNRDTRETADGTVICNNCEYHYYFTCAQCGEIYSNHDKVTHGRRSYCNDCYETLVEMEATQ